MKRVLVKPCALDAKSMQIYPKQSTINNAYFLIHINKHDTQPFMDHYF